ncbi:MAG: FeoA family protein [Chitinophagales bacterium]
MKPLTEVQEGQSVYILDLRNDRLCIEFFEKGCFPGDQIHIIQNSPLHKFIVFLSGGNRYRLYRNYAAAVITGIYSHHICLN